jgi:hypothetical protein
MTKALTLAALTLTLTACAGTHMANAPSPGSAATASGSEAWRMAPKPNAARLANESATPTRALDESAMDEAWQMARRPNAARLAVHENESARQFAPRQSAMILRANKAMP